MVFNKHMKISVVIPAYNQGHFLVQAIQSVMAQDPLPDEVIVVDDGSTDDTREIVGGFSNAVNYVHQQHVGPAEARNRGISAATGDAIMFLDADDALASGWVAKALKAQAQTAQDGQRPGVVYGDYHLFREPGGYRERTKTRRATLERLLRDPLVIPSGALVSRHCIEQVGPFREEFTPCEDWDYWIRAALAGFAFTRVPTCAFTHREHEASLSKQEIHALQKRVYLLNNWLDCSDLDSKHRQILKKELARSLLRLYRASYRQNLPTDGFVGQAFAADPDLPRDPRAFVFGAVYSSPYFREQIAFSDPKGAIESLAQDFWHESLDRRLRLDRKRLRASTFVALAANNLFDHRFTEAGADLLRALKADPRLLWQGAADLTAEAQRFFLGA